MGRGKVAVDVYLQTEPDIFVIGDNANTPYSGLAQTALRDGEFVATNLRRRARGKTFDSYTARTAISVVPAGPRWALLSSGGSVRIYGWLGLMPSAKLLRPENRLPRSRTLVQSLPTMVQRIHRRRRLPNLRRLTELAIVLLGVD